MLTLGSCLVVSRLQSNDAGVPGLPFRDLLWFFFLIPPTDPISANAFIFLFLSLTVVIWTLPTRFPCQIFTLVEGEFTYHRLSSFLYDSAGADQLEHATPILSLCHGIFTDWSVFSIPFLFYNKGSSAPVTHWRQLVSCDWSWHSHESLTPSRFDQKMNRSMKTPWQEYSGVVCSYS